MRDFFRWYLSEWRWVPGLLAVAAIILSSIAIVLS
jgi:hypothetical protein